MLFRSRHGQPPGGRCRPRCATGPGSRPATGSRCGCGCRRCCPGSRASPSAPAPRWRRRTSREVELAAGNGQAGQATVELVAGLPALLLAALLALQLLAAGYALTLADGAAEAGALALASGRDAAPAARDALPGWARKRAAVRVDGGRVSVEVRPPSPLGWLSERLDLSSSAWARRPG